MDRLSLKAKLGLLGAFFIFIISLIGFVGIKSSNDLKAALNEVGLVQLPAVRNMTLVDMMHDGLKAVVFKALYFSDNMNETIAQELTQDLKEMSENLKTYLANVEALPLRSDTKQAIADSKAEVENYSRSAEEIVNLALARKKDLISDRLKNFEKAFDDLEEKLEVLGELIEKDSQQSVEASSGLAKKSITLSYLILVFSLLFGIATMVIFSSKLAKRLTTVADNLTSNANLVASTAQQVAASSQMLSQATTEQASSLEETAASLEEITAMISKSTENAETTSINSTESQKKAELGRGAVTKMISSMDEISESNTEILNQINESNRQMTEIVKVIQDIGTRTKVINEIVFQTKLLSFNASVEAARAGEHGKGFAVVAEEVGNLAQMSGNAAKEITDMLSASITKVEGIVKDTQVSVEKLILAGKDKVSTGIIVARQCSDVLNEIVQNVSRVAGLSQEISQASKEQAQGVGEINRAVSQLDAVTQQNASTSEATASAADALSAQALSLKDAVASLLLAVNGRSSSTTAAGDLNTHNTTNSESTNVVPLATNSKVTTRLAAGDEFTVPRHDDQGFNT